MYCSIYLVKIMNFYIKTEKYLNIINKDVRTLFQQLLRLEQDFVSRTIELLL